MKDVGSNDMKNLKKSVAGVRAYVPGSYIYTSGWERFHNSKIGTRMLS